MDQKSYKYAYNILYYEGDKKREAGECKGFVEELNSRFEKRTNYQYRAFWHWSEKIGGNKFELLPNVRKNSKLTIVLFSPHFVVDEWHDYSQKQALMFNLSTERLLPVSIMDSEIPEHLIQITPLKFHLDWRDDSRSWKLLLNAICENLNNVQRKITSQISFSGEDDDHDESTDDECLEVVEFPNNDQLDELADNIGHEKNQIGTRLGFKYSEMDKIENDHMRNTHNQILTMLITWRQRNKKGAEEKSNTLQSSLKKSGRADLAEKVKKYYKAYTKQMEEKEKVQEQKRAKKAMKLQAKMEAGRVKKAEEICTREKEMEADQIKKAEEISAREKETIKHFDELNIRHQQERNVFEESKSKMVTGKEESKKKNAGRSSLFDQGIDDIDSEPSINPKAIEESPNTVTSASNVRQFDINDEIDGQQSIRHSGNHDPGSTHTRKGLTEGTDNGVLEHLPKSENQTSKTQYNEKWENVAAHPIPPSTVENVDSNRHSLLENPCASENIVVNSSDRNREHTTSQERRIAREEPLGAETDDETRNNSAVVTQHLSIVESVGPLENLQSEYSKRACPDGASDDIKKNVDDETSMKTPITSPGAEKVSFFSAMKDYFWGE